MAKRPSQSSLSQLGQQAKIAMEALGVEVPKGFSLIMSPQATAFIIEVLASRDWTVIISPSKEASDNIPSIKDAGDDNDLYLVELCPPGSLQGFAVKGKRLPLVLTAAFVAAMQALEATPDEPKEPVEDHGSRVEEGR